MIMPSACDKSLVYRIAETTQIVNIHSCSRMGSVGQREHFFPVRSTVRFPGCAAAEPQSDFVAAASSVPFGGLMQVLDEHMKAIKLVYPKEYELVMRKISDL